MIIARIVKYSSIQEPSPSTTIFKIEFHEPFHIYGLFPKTEIEKSKKKKSPHGLRVKSYIKYLPKGSTQDSGGLKDGPPNNISIQVRNNEGEINRAWRVVFDDGV